MPFLSSRLSTAAAVLVLAGSLLGVVLSARREQTGASGTAAEQEGNREMRNPARLPQPAPSGPNRHAAGRPPVSARSSPPAEPEAKMAVSTPSAGVERIAGLFEARAPDTDPRVPTSDEKKPLRGPPPWRYVATAVDERDRRVYLFVGVPRGRALVLSEGEERDGWTLEDVGQGGFRLANRGGSQLVRRE